MSDDLRVRLTARASSLRIDISPSLLDPLERYYRLLKRWNARINLTGLALDEPSDATLDRLFFEPLAAAALIQAKPMVWLDLGSGGGSPAIPLKLARPLLDLTMVESKARKAAFLREAVRDLALSTARVENVRFEELASRPQSKGMVQLVTVRAVRPDEALFDTAARLLGSGRTLMLLGADDDLPATRGFVAVDERRAGRHPAFKLRVFRRL